MLVFDWTLKVYEITVVENLRLFYDCMKD